MAERRVIGVIPARLESSRFPRKVLTPVLHRPLIQYAYERLDSATLVDDVLVATDSESVCGAVREFGGRVVMVSEPCACGSDRVREAVRGLEASVVVNLQADQPLISPSDIDRTVEAIIEDESIEIATLAFEADDRAGFERSDVVKVVIDRSGRALYFSRAPIPASAGDLDGNPLYLHHVGIYCFRRAALERFASLSQGAHEVRESLEQLRALEHGMTVRVVLTDKCTPSVDRADDVPEVERRLSSI